MDRMNDLTTGAKVVLGATIAFLIVSFFTWFDYNGPGSDQLSAIGADTGVTMWHGVGVVAGLVAIALLVWQAVRLANLQFEVGVTPSMVTAALAILLLVFTFIRWIDKPGGDFVGRTFWSWLGLAFAVVVVVGAWLNMRATGESLADVRASVSGAAAAARGAVERDDKPAATPPPATPSEPAASTGPESAATSEAPAAPEPEASPGEPDAPSSS
jgi:hypothetical protein